MRSTRSLSKNEYEKMKMNNYTSYEDLNINGSLGFRKSDNQYIE